MNDMAATIMTTAEVAAEFGTTPRELRKFLRSEQGMNATVGKGKRWGIEKRQLRGLRTRFDAWSSAKANDADEAPTTDEAPAEG